MPRFHVGDSVRVVENTDRTPIGVGGQIGIVTEVYDDAAPGQEFLYAVQFDGVGPDWPIYESALETEAREA